ncbi:hypothetical protein EMCRGX_G011959 [Ephydatia muelleri]
MDPPPRTVRKFPWGRFQGKSFLVIDSKWSEVVAMDETTTDRTVDELHAIFALWGIPLQMVSDTGPSSLQQDSNYFLALNNIHVTHLKSSPYHPATNGLVECLVQTLQQALRVFKRDVYTAAQPGQLLIELLKRICDVGNHVMACNKSSHGHMTTKTLKLIGKRRNKNTLQKRAEVKFRSVRGSVGVRGQSHQMKLPPVPDEENTLGGQPFYNANWCETQETVSDSGDDAYWSYLGTVTVPEHSFIVVEQLIPQDILGLQQQGLVLDFTTSPVSDTVARQSCDNTCEHNTCTSTTTRPRSTAAAVNMESRAREESKGPNTFQKLMDVVMRGLPFVTNYIDDILIHSEYEESFQRLKASLTEASVLAYPQTGQHHDTADRCQQSTCPQFSPPMGTYSCPGSYIAYTCVLSSSAPLGVVTVWGGSAFQCPPTNHISLTQRAGGTVQPFTPRSCGNLSAVTTNVTSTCYTSVLTIPAVQALNGTTVVCQDGISGAVVGSGTVNLRMAASPGPVGNMTVKWTSVDQLTVTWTPPTVPTSYNVTINDSSSPVVIADNGSPVYTHTFTGLVSDTLYTISVVAINCAGASNAVQHHRRTCTVENFIDASVSYHGPSNAVIDCTFLNNQSLYCVVCCSTDPSVPPDSSVYNISTTRGTEVTVSLQGLTSGQMYYCTAAGTDAYSSSCGGLVVGGVKAYFNISAELDRHPDGESHEVIIVVVVISIFIVICIVIFIVISIVIFIVISIVISIVIFIIRLESGVQQGDPLGPLLFCLVLHKVVTAIAADSICSQLSFHSWYMDDGVIAGSEQAALQALSIIKQLGPPLGLFINTSKCELFSKGGHRGFPDEMKKSNALIFEILGRQLETQSFVPGPLRRKEQMPLTLEGLHLFDEEVRQTFSDSMCIDPSDLVWQQAQLSLSRGGLGLRSAPLHSSAAFMSSFSMSGFATNTSHHLLQSLDHFNACVSQAEVISIDELLNSSMTQKMLSTNIENKQFQLLFDASSIPNRALSA